MSCFSRLVGLVCAVVPGLIFLAFSVRFFQLWPKLGFVVGPFYSLVSFVTGAICLYLGVSLVVGGDHHEEPAPVLDAVPEPAATSAPIVAEPIVVEAAPLQAAPLQAAPLPVIEAPVVEPASAPVSASSSPSIFSKSNETVAPDTPQTRIRQLALTRPHWQVTAAQLAQLTNFNMAVVDAAAREMVGDGSAQVQTGPNGETVYLFNLADEKN